MPSLTVNQKVGQMNKCVYEWIRGRSTDRDGEAGKMDEWKGDFKHTYPAGSS